MRKLLITMLVCVFLLSSLSVAAITIQEDTGDTNNISNSSQIFKITALSNGTVAFSSKNPPVIWERPALLAGEYMERPSSLILHNATGKTQTVVLESVELPYNNEDALRYLNHLTITVTNGNEVLYKGPYSRINEKESNFSIKTELPTNSQIVYNIHLSCDYRYKGTGFGESDQILWKFRTEASTQDSVDNVEDNSSFANPVILQVALAIVLTIFLAAALILYRYLKNR